MYYHCVKSVSFSFLNHKKCKPQRSKTIFCFWPTSVATKQITTLVWRSSIRGNNPSVYAWKSERTLLCVTSAATAACKHLHASACIFKEVHSLTRHESAARELFLLSHCTRVASNSAQEWQRCGLHWNQTPAHYSAGAQTKFIFSWCVRDTFSCIFQRL
jgi:hypothetical protein